jgi:hypothetical protein
MRPRRGTVAAALRTLEQAVHGGTVGPLEQALAGVEQALRGQDDHLHAVKGVTDVECGQTSSPTMDRRVAGLHDELDRLLAEASALREALQSARRETTETPSRPVMDGLLCRAAALAESLAAYERDEAELIQQAVTTDIGAGD